MLDASVPVLFANAWLAKGVVNPNGTASIDLANPLDHSVAFLAQDTDFAPYYFKNPHDLSETINAGLLAAAILALNDPALSKRLQAWRARQTRAIKRVPVSEKKKAK